MVNGFGRFYGYPLYFVNLKHYLIITNIFFMKLEVGMQVTSSYGGRGKIIKIVPNEVYNIWVEGYERPYSDSELKPVTLRLKSTERKWMEHKKAFQHTLPDLSLHGSQLSGEQLDAVANFIGGFPADIPYGDNYLEYQWFLIRKYGALEYRRQSYTKWLEHNSHIAHLIEIDKMRETQEMLEKLDPFERALLADTILQ